FFVHHALLAGLSIQTIHSETTLPSQLRRAFRFFLACPPLSTRGCAPARQCIRVPTPRRHVAAPRSVHTSTGTSDALNDHHDTIPVRHCSPSYRFGDQLPFKSHSAPRPPQTPAASS